MQILLLQGLPEGNDEREAGKVEERGVRTLAPLLLSSPSSHDDDGNDEKWNTPLSYIHFSTRRSTSLPFDPISGASPVCILLFELHFTLKLLFYYPF